jgi:diaminopimelate epimerase
MTQLAPAGRPFLKMHGAGNDFIILDGRARPWPMSVENVRRLTDRRTGVGGDEVIIIEAAKNPGADAFMTIINPDGMEVAACGNATRCVAWLLMSETGGEQTIIETKAGLLTARRAGDHLVSVDMGPALLEWQQIPLSCPTDTLHLGIGAGPLLDPVAVGMGNPHAVFFVEDAEAIDLPALGPILEHDRLFPERCNIEVVQVIAPDRLRMRVWERSVGITLACGSGACASLVAAHRRGLTGRKAEVILDGGTLSIEWLDTGHVLMTGPVALSFTGNLLS